MLRRFALMGFAIAASLPERMVAQQLLDPYVARSPSRAFELSVDPGEPNGGGPARCELRCHGDFVWSRELELTPWAAAVTDRGRFAGYAYTRGFDGNFSEGEFRGELAIQFFDERGEVLREERIPREHHIVDGATYPSAAGAFAQPDLDRYVVRVWGQGDPCGEKWHVFEHSTGAPLFETSSCASIAAAAALKFTFGVRPPAPAPPRDVQALALEELGRVPLVARGELLEAGACFVDALGRILLQDLRGGAVHVFDAQGARSFVCTPDPGDFREPSSSARIAVTGAGQILVERKELEFVRFSALGERVGRERFQGDRLAFRPGTSEAWIAWRDAVVRIAEKGRDELRIRRSPDGAWLRFVPDFAFDAQGELAVLSKTYGAETGARVSLFDAQGVGLRTIELPPIHAYGVAHGVDWIAVVGAGSSLLLVRKSDGLAYLFELAPRASPRHARHVSFSPDGRELWVLDLGSRELRRYALPEA